MTRITSRSVIRSGSRTTESSVLAWASVIAAAFFPSVAAFAPESDVPETLTSSDDAIRSSFGFHNDPCPIRFWLLQAPFRPASVTQRHELILLAWLLRGHY